MYADIVVSLMQGEKQYPRAFVAAQEFWSEFYENLGDVDDAQLQAAIDRSQRPFERHMAEQAGLLRPFAKSIMALTALGALYRDGFEDPVFAGRVVRCLVAGDTLSLDVKMAAEWDVKIYGLEDSIFR